MRRDWSAEVTPGCGNWRLGMLVAGGCGSESCARRRRHQPLETATSSPPANTFLRDQSYVNRRLFFCTSLITPPTSFLTLISLQPRLATTTAACSPPHPKKERKRERERKRREGEGKELRPHPSPRARRAWSRRVVWLSRSSTCTRNADRATGRRASTVSRRRVRASPPP